MATTRYVWSKWEVGKKLVQTGSNPYNGFAFGGSKPPVYYSTVATVNNDGTIKLSDPVGQFSNLRTLKSMVGYYWYWGKADNLKECCKNGSVRIDDNELVWGNGGESEGGPFLYFEGRLSKGTTSYGNVSSAASSAYASNGVTGNYWYVSKGSDNIDPVTLTYSDAVKAGENVTLTITPSTGTTLGGNISYVIQTTVNGTDWYDADTTSETTCTLTVPSDAIVWGVRAYAKDDSGFTSETYVYGNGIEGTVNVIRVGISPPSGNIGYITDKNVMYVSVNADSAYTFTVKMDGETLSSSSSSSSTVQQITLTDEKFNALEEDTPYTLTVEIVISGTTTTREYTFRKFTYDATTTEGVWTGIGRAVRIRRKIQSQILGASAPKEIIKIDNPVSTQELQAATATPDKVVKGYTFYAGNNELKTGTLSGMTKVAQMSINDRISPTSNNATKTYTINTNFTPLILRTGIDMEGEVHTNVSSDGISYSIYVYKYIEGLSAKIKNTVYSSFMGQDTSLTYQKYDNPLKFDVKFNENTVTMSVTAWSVKGTIYVYGI